MDSKTENYPKDVSSEDNNSPSKVGTNLSLSEATNEVSVKAATKSALLAKRRLQAYTASKLQLANIPIPTDSPSEVVKEPDKDPEKAKMSQKKAKRELYPDEKFKSTIKEIEHIKKTQPIIHLTEKRISAVPDQIVKNLTNVQKSQIFNTRQTEVQNYQMSNETKMDNIVIIDEQISPIKELKSQTTKNDKPEPSNDIKTKQSSDHKQNSDVDNKSQLRDHKSQSRLIEYNNPRSQSRSRSKSFDRCSERSDHFKKIEGRERNYRKTSTSAAENYKSPVRDPRDLRNFLSSSSKRNPTCWSEYKEHSKKYLRDIKSKQVEIQNKLNQQNHLFPRYFTFETPAAFINYRFSRNENEAVSIPFKFVRQTTAKPNIIYSVNHNRIKETHVSREQLFAAVSSNRKELIENIINSKRCPTAKKCDQRRWFPKSWKKGENADAKLVENSYGLSFLQNYSDEEEEEIDTSDIEEQLEIKTKELEAEKFEHDKKEKEERKMKKIGEERDSTRKEEEISIKKKNEEEDSNKKKNEEETSSKKKNEKEIKEKPSELESSLLETQREIKKLEADLKGSNVKIEGEVKEKEKKKNKKKSKKTSSSEDSDRKKKKKKKLKKKKYVEEDSDSSSSSSEDEKEKRRRKKSKLKKIKKKSKKSKKAAEEEEEEPKPKKKSKHDKSDSSDEKKHKKNKVEDTVDRQKIIEDLMEKIDTVEKIKSRKLKEKNQTIISENKSSEWSEIEEEEVEVKNKEKDRPSFGGRRVYWDDSTPKNKHKNIVKLDEIEDVLKQKKEKHDKHDKSSKSKEKTTPKEKEEEEMKNKEKSEKKDKKNKDRRRSISEDLVKHQNPSKEEACSKRKRSRTISSDRDVKKEKKSSKSEKYSKTEKEKKEKSSERKPLESKSSERKSSERKSSERKSSERKSSADKKNEKSRKRLYDEDSDCYNAQWESEDEPILEKDQPSTSWESEEEIFEREEYPKTALIKNYEPLEMPFNIRPYSRRNRWDVGDQSLDAEIKLLRRESRTLSEERKRLEIEKIRIQHLEMSYKELDRSDRRKHEEDKISYEKESEKYKEKRKKHHFEEIEFDLKKVKKEKPDLDISSTTDVVAKKETKLENEYEEFMKAVSSSGKKSGKSGEKADESWEESSSSGSSSSYSSDSESEENEEPVKIKVEKKSPIIEKPTNIITDLKEIKPKDVAASKIKPVPVPVPVPLLKVEDIPKPLLNISIPTIIETVLKATSSPNTNIDLPQKPKGASQKIIKDLIDTPTSDIPLPAPQKTITLNLTPQKPKILLVSPQKCVSPQSTQFSKVAPSVEVYQCQIPQKQVLSPEKIEKSSNDHSSLNFEKQSDCSDVSQTEFALDDSMSENNSLYEERREIKDQFGQRAPLNFTLMGKRSLVPSSIVNLGFETLEEEKVPISKFQRDEEIKKIEAEKRSEIPSTIKEIPEVKQTKEIKQATSEHRRRSRSPSNRRRSSRDRSPRRGRWGSSDRSRRSPRRDRRSSPSRSSKRSDSPRRRSPQGRRRSRSPKDRRRRSISPRRRSISPKPRAKEVNNSPMGGLKKSVADSTISDDLLPQPSHHCDEYQTETHSSRLYERQMNKGMDSPKRVPLDVRINQVLGIKEPPKDEIKDYEFYDHYADQYNYQNQNMAQRTTLKGYNQPNNYKTPRNQVVQVGNMLQILPQENVQHISLPKTPQRQLTMDELQARNMAHFSKESKVLQVGNVLEIVPQEFLPEVLVKLPPPPPPPPPPEEKPKAVIPAVVNVVSPSAEDAMKLKTAERRAERLRRRQDKEKRRKEKDKRKKEKEKEKQQRLKIRTENMIKKALLMEQEGEEMVEEEEEAPDNTLQWPPTFSVIHLNKEAGKSILIKKKQESAEVRKSVQFADGIRPGEGTSPSGGEELSSPPPQPKKLPKEKRYKKTKLPKKTKKKKTKVKKPKPTDESDEEDNLPPPSPPPGSPPPHIFPPRIKPAPINNIHPYVTALPPLPATPPVYPTASNPGVYPPTPVTPVYQTTPGGTAYQVPSSSSYQTPNNSAYPSPNAAVYQTGSTSVYQTGSSQAVYQTGSSQAVYQTGSNQAVYQTGSSPVVYQTGSSPAVYQTGSGQALYQTPSSSGYQGMYRSPMPIIMPPPPPSRGSQFQPPLPPSNVYHTTPNSRGHKDSKSRSKHSSKRRSRY